MRRITQSRLRLALLTAAAIAVAGAVAVPAASAFSGRSAGDRTVEYRDNDSGTVRSGADTLDFDPDNGVAPVIGQAEGRSTFGRTVHDLITEIDGVRLTELDGCPDNLLVAFRFIHNAAVRTFANGDQLWSTHDPDDPGFICVLEDFSTIGQYNQIVTGGTGRFEGATGTIVTRFETGNFLPGTGGRIWGPSSHHAEGTIHLARS